MKSAKKTIRLEIPGHADYWLSLDLDPSLSMKDQMTGLLFAIDLFKKENKLAAVKLMFDEDNPTTPEEVLENDI